MQRQLVFMVTGNPYCQPVRCQVGPQSLNPLNPSLQHRSYKPFEINQYTQLITFPLKKEKINHPDDNQADYPQSLAEKQQLETHGR